MAESERPLLLFSGGKDRIVMLCLTEKAFYPASIPVAVMYVETGHNFDEVLAFLDQRVEFKAQFIVASVQEAIDSRTVRQPPDGTRNRIQTPVLPKNITSTGVISAPPPMP